jgi:hypothetical protein
VTSAQQGFLGSTGSGFLERSPAMDPHGHALAASVEGRHVNSSLSNSLRGVTELFRGQCDESKTLLECRQAALTSGVIPRPDLHWQTNNVLAVRERYDRCVRLGLSGADLRICSAGGR